MEIKEKMLQCVCVSVCVTRSYGPKKWEVQKEGAD